MTIAALGSAAEGDRVVSRRGIESDGIAVEIRDGTRAGVRHDRVAELVRHVLRAEAVMSAEVDVQFVGRRRMRALNGTYRGIDAVTDVLSFPLEEPGEEPLPGVPRLLGDVVVCPLEARRQALADGAPAAFELAVLITHGLLHLVGWEHGEQPGRMALRQGELLADWRWKDLW
jgi:probable rRNA maturation factor